MPLREAAAPVAVLGVLGAVNLLNNRWAPQASVPTSVAATAVVAAIGRGHAAGRRPAGPPAPGDARARRRRGLRYGGAAAGAVAAAYTVAAVLPATRPLFADDRAEDTLPGVLRQALVDVPLGTVLLEETAFRGVLPAVLRQTCGPVGAEWASIALFGLWHVLPSGDLLTANPALTEVSTGGRTPTRLGAAAGAVVTTAAGGAVFTLLRQRSGSLLAPALLHTALNSGGYLASWAVRRLSR
ncbi:CPBP family intramembrane metalloprotease [Streptomyces sp. 549]|uniref:CPBP family intramembrane glutamic endopeptidase n=1 Tax=Streptomyces sp. 549 TaxID=3049076 RepID=UPI0024C285CC|nr:CPBP family intramembrane metalloprotease [Streptomyces sp. 549]MDK1476773.1 CPBP family intramembrane metalloprotease [Streptomyces sp. 549]